MPVLEVPSFGGGVVREGSADAQRTDEMRAADSYDIGPRGQLVPASDLTNFVNVSDGTGNLTRTFGIAVGGTKQLPRFVLVGNGPANKYAIATISPDGGTIGVTTITHALLTSEVLVSFVSFPYVDAGGVQTRVVLVCIGARETDNPRAAVGLYVLRFSAGAYLLDAIDQFDFLGTGPKGEASSLPGTLGSKAYPRFIVAYNNFVFLFGYAAADATNGDGPNRVMFSNVGNPLKFGFDAAAAAIAAGTAVETDRHFADTDAFTIGGAGETSRCGYVWNGKLWVGTNSQLHYIEGFGRESFITNGSVPVKRSKNVIGPNAMIEGPDGLLYGVSDDGLWAFDGAVVDPVGNKLRDFAKKSKDYWDLIWTDTSFVPGYPGTTNRDLVWMLAVKDLMQVWVVIPHCDASAGYGWGGDTVIIKYHTLTGGFTRQVITGKLLTHGTIYEADASARKQTVLCKTTAGAGETLIRYGYQALPTDSPIMPVALPDVTIGPYAPHGPNGTGVCRKLWTTLSWESSASLPLVFNVTPTIDGKATSTVKLTVGATTPVSPANGDIWVDTSGTDTNIGNGTAGSIIPASAGDFIVREYVTTWAKWRYTGHGGPQGTRATIPLPHDVKKGTRVQHRIALVSAGGRYQFESAAIDPSTIRAGQ